MPSLVVIGQQIIEKQRGGGTMCRPAYILTKYPSLNGVKVPSVLCHSQKDATRDWPSLVKLGTSYQ